MSDRMTPIPFRELMTWILDEKEKHQTVFGIRKAYHAKGEKFLSIFGEKMETPFGPAAGPHTQLAQNIVAAYYAGSRFFELKTVQKLDGEDLPVAKPCITADDECYNCEWSTELYVPQAFDEYVKAWFALKLLSKEYDLGAADGFVFNMSVGYDLEGIMLPKIDRFIEGLKDASETDIFKECKAVAAELLPRFKKVTRSDIDAIGPQICNSATLSTLHGCPPQEIERIASYLITEKKVNTFIKCNPTLLGYEYARKTMDDMGYDYVAFGDFHFKDDLQYSDAVPMLQRLQALADDKGLAFGVKITNTFPVDVKAGELPSEEMYMSGRSLYALSISVAAKLAKDFDGKLRISYSGGADYHNIQRIYEAGIWPITMATTMLKPGGYARLVQIGEIFDGVDYHPFERVIPEAVEKLRVDALTDKHHTKPVKPLLTRKTDKHVPLADCFFAPCEEGCPIHQDITLYMKLEGEGRYEEALQTILDKNPLPFMTGTICNHRCMSRCTRNFYEEPVGIRSSKLIAAKGGFDAVIAKQAEVAKNREGKTAIIGGGPAGMAAAYFLARAGKAVTIFERKDSLGGIVKHVIPEFRIPTEDLKKDVALLEALGVEVRLNTEVKSIVDVKAEGFDSVIVAIGAWKAGDMEIENAHVEDAIEFLEEFKKTNGQMDIGEHVVVIGAGNTAMDTARAAKKTRGVKSSSILYRRTKRYMPADEEELQLAFGDDIDFKELLAPQYWKDGVLTCRKMILGPVDSTGRRSPVETDELVQVPADTIIAAVGEQTDAEFYRTNGITVDKKGRPVLERDTMATNVPDVYAIGDGACGPAVVVEAIRDAIKAAEAILGEKVTKELEDHRERAEIDVKTGNIVEPKAGVPDTNRCVSCASVCENCVEVCPNRANISVDVPSKAMPQIIHVDKMCNECGNCMTFCPYDSAPYKHKFTLFANEKDFADSENEGFVLLDEETLTFKVRLGEDEIVVSGLDGKTGLPADIEKMMAAVYHEYRYMM